MRVVFMGTPAFAVPSLQALIELHDVLAVYTRPDSISGRGGNVRPSAVKVAALAAGLTLRQPKTLRDDAEQQWLAALAPDVIAVAAYGLILPPAVLEIPRLGCINVHASALPRWRGAAPIERAILAGDDSVGVSIMRMEEGLDTGPYAEVVEVSADDLNAPELTTVLAREGAAALIRSLDALASGDISWLQQDEHLATYAPKIDREDVALSPTLTREDVVRRVRASSGRAPARLTIGGHPMTVVEARRDESEVAPGAAAVTKHALLLGTADGTVALERVKPDGRGEMDGAAWARGARLPQDAEWGSVR